MTPNLGSHLSFQNWKQSNYISSNPCIEGKESRVCHLTQPRYNFKQKFLTLWVVCTRRVGIESSCLLGLT